MRPRPPIEKILERVTSGETVALQSEEIADLCRYILEREKAQREHLDLCSRKLDEYLGRIQALEAEADERYEDGCRDAYLEAERDD